MKAIATILLASVSTCLLGAASAFAQIQAPGPSGQIFLDNFDGYTVQTGNPPPDFYKNGNLTTVGVSTGGVSGQAGFYGINFSAANPSGQSAFGGSINDTLEGKTLNLTNGMLSVSVMSSAGPAVEGYFSIRIVDTAEDAYRSPFYNPTAAYTTFAPAFSTFIDNAGTGKINLAKISEIDLIAYNLGDNVVTTLTFDNLQAITVPEPSALVSAMLLGGSLLVIRRRRGRTLRGRRDF